MVHRHTYPYVIGFWTMQLLPFRDQSQDHSFGRKTMVVMGLLHGQPQVIAIVAWFTGDLLLNGRVLWAKNQRPNHHVEQIPAACDR